MLGGSPKVLITRKKVLEFCFEYVFEVPLGHSRDDGCMGQA